MRWLYQVLQDSIITAAQLLIQQNYLHRMGLQIPMLKLKQTSISNVHNTHWSVVTNVGCEMALLQDKVVVGHDIGCDLWVLWYQYPLADVWDTALHYRAGQCQELGLLQVQIGTCKGDALALDCENWICKSREGWRSSYGVVCLLWMRSGRLRTTGLYNLRS